ncbi:HamA C-terminal domain-containing protein [Enterococcus malodoratus]|uniref:HamA C-terminal domain-containing protein n=1 Tax=Enterococcus malodoratus TaxID=71451 RepID=UPI003FD01387
MISISQKAIDAVKSFEFLKDLELFEGQGNSTTMHIFMPRLNGREFDFEDFQANLLEVVVDFSLSRSTVKKYEADRKWQQMSKEARQKFRDYTSNTGELGELILYTFLEGHLSAPQILSKMSLKTTSGDYTKKSDRIHFVKEDNSERYHLIFGEAKMYQDISSAFKNAFQSISIHQDGKDFEKSLISSQIDSELMNDEDKQFVTDILYPSRTKTDVKVSDAFGIFIGFEIDDARGKTLSEDEYESWVKNEIGSIIQKRIKTIERYLSDEWDFTENSKTYHKTSLIGKYFYVYLMPFTNLNENRKRITKGVTE